MEKRRQEIEERFKRYQKKEQVEENNFLKEFSLQKDQILKDLEESKDLNVLKEQTYQLNQKLQDNTPFISKYEVQKCSESLKLLRNKLEEKSNQTQTSFNFTVKEKSQDIVSKPSEDHINKVEETKSEQKVFSKLENSVIDNLDENEDLIIKDCISSKVYITCVTSALYLNDIKDSLICVGPVKGSIIVRNCTNCQFNLASKQVRKSQLTFSYVYMIVLIVIFS